MTRIHWNVLLAVFISAVALVVRVPGLGDFMTVDEGLWMVRSAQFYEAVQKGDLGATYLTTHPGSVPMWLIGFGEALQEKRVGVSVDEGTLPLFRRAAVWPVAAATSVAAGFIVFWLTRLFGTWPAAAAGTLLATEPYVAGMSQIAHLDALQGFFMMAGLLAFLVASSSPTFDRRAMMGAGIFWGLALGCKLLLALWLAPVFVLLALVEKWRSSPFSWAAVVRRLGFVMGLAALIFWLSWPALWVKTDLGYSLTRDYTSVVTDEHIAFEATEDSIAPATFYIRTVVGRLTPHVQILLVASSLYPVASIFRRRRATNYYLLATLVLYALGYLVLISLAAKKADRYALPALVVAPVVAGWVVAWIISNIESRIKNHALGRRYVVLVSCLLFAAVIALPVLLSPYAVAYNNPFVPNVRPLPQQGWGEGLEEAAAWLNTRPGAAEMYVASWYPRVLQTYFRGKVLSLSSRSDGRVQYIVVYRNMGGRGSSDQATAVLEELRDKAPVHVIAIQGVPYVLIYDTQTLSTFDRHVGELFGQKSVGQTVQPEGSFWSWIDIGFATFSSRRNTEEVVVHIKASPEAAEDLRVMRIAASDLVDNEWRRFVFEPLLVSGTESFYVVVDSPTSGPGNAITVRTSEADVRPGVLYVNGESRAGDMAYRIRE